MTPLRRAALATSTVLLLALPGSGAAETPVYRCVEGGRVLYADYPCRNAEVVELHPGTADPEAGRRRAQAQATLDAGMEQLRAEKAREADRRAAIADAEAYAWAAPFPEPIAGPAVESWPVFGGYYGPVRPRPNAPGVKPRDRAHSGGRPQGSQGARPPTGGKPPAGARPPAVGNPPMAGKPAGAASATASAAAAVAGWAIARRSRPWSRLSAESSRRCGRTPRRRTACPALRR